MLRLAELMYGRRTLLLLVMMLSFVISGGCGGGVGVEKPNPNPTNACPTPYDGKAPRGAPAQLLAQSTHAGTTGWHAGGPVDSMVMPSGHLLVTLGSVLYGDASLRFWDVSAGTLLRNVPLAGVKSPARLASTDAGEIIVADAERLLRVSLDGTVISSTTWSPAGVSPHDASGARMVDLATTKTGAFAVTDRRGSSGLVTQSLTFVPWDGPSKTLKLEEDLRFFGMVADPVAPNAVIVSRDVELVVASSSAEPRTAWTGKRRVALLGVSGGARFAAVRMDVETPGSGASRENRATELAVIDLEEQKLLWTRDPASIAGVKSFALTTDPASSSLPEQAVFDAEVSWLVVATSDGRMLRFDAMTGRFRGEMGSKAMLTSRVVFLDDTRLVTWGGTMAAGRSDVWSTKTGRLLESYDQAALIGPAAGHAWRLRGGEERCENGGIRIIVEAHPSEAGADLIDRCIGADRQIRAFDPYRPRLLIDEEHGSSLLDLSTGHETEIGARATFTFLGQVTEEMLGLATFIDWSLDGSSLASLEPRSRTTIEITPTSGTGGKSRIETKERVDRFGLAPDGSRIVVAHGKSVAVYPRSGGTPEAFVTSRTVSSVGFGSSASDVLVGFEDGAFELRRGGSPIATGLPVGSAVRGAVVSPSGKRAAMWHADRVVRIRNLDDGALLASIVSFENGEYLTSTPGGAHVATPEAAQHVALVYSSPLEAFSLERLGPSFERPDLLARRLAGLDVDVDGSLDRPPSPALKGEVTKTSSGRARLTVVASSVRRVEIVRVFVEGRIADETLLCEVNGEVTFELPLLPGRNRLAVVAYDDRGLPSNPLAVDVQATGEVNRPDLWIVAVGVSDYPKLGPEMQLDVADDDARAIAETLSKQAGGEGPYARAHVVTLIDEAATPQGIGDALRALENAHPDDLVVVFLSGHGYKADEDGAAVFLTSGASLSAQGVPEGGLGWDVIGAALGRVRGRVLVLVDACHAGHLDRKIVLPNEAVARALAADGRAGSIVFAASKGRQQSFEPNHSKGVKRLRLEMYAPKAGTNGLFTAAVLESFSSPVADRNGDGALQLSELVDDVTARVNLASQGLQTPWLARREVLGDFGIAKLPASAPR